MAIYEGEGAVSIKGQRAGELSYRIETFMSGGLIDNIGSITGDINLIRSMFEQGSVEMTLATGQAVEVLVTDWSPGSPARIRVNGRLPV